MRKNKVDLDMDFDEWVQYGYDRKWCLPPTCDTHDGVPMTIDEEAAYEAGGDPCIHVLRVFDTPENWTEGRNQMESILPYRL